MKSVCSCAIKRYRKLSKHLFCDTRKKMDDFHKYILMKPFFSITIMHYSEKKPSNVWNI